MKKQVFLVAATLLGFSAFSQETTYGGIKQKLGEVHEDRPNVLIISFEDKMYRSDIDKELGQHNGMDQQQLQQFFQRAVPATLTNAFNTEFNVMPFDEIVDNSMNNSSVVSFIHQSLKYQYELLENVEDSTKRKPLWNRNKKHKEPENGLFEGQVKVTTSNQEKYMKAIITNDTLLSYLQRHYEFDYLLLVNELDLTYQVENPDMAAYGGIRKQVKTHYTVYSKEGKLINSGAKKAYFDYQEKDINLIAGRTLPEVANKILVSFRNGLGKEVN